MSVEIAYSSFWFHIQPLEPIILPSYKGSTLRGGFGNAFRRVVCALKNRECSACLLKEKCVYSYIFETPPPSDTSIMRKYTSAPHPFIIDPPPERKRGYTPKDELEFGLTLIGRAVDYLPYFVYAFDELGKIGIGKGKGKYELKTVWMYSDASVHGDKNVIYASDTKTLQSFAPLKLSVSFDTELRTHNSKLLTLNFLTPTRIIYNGHLALDIEFHMLIRQLLRRISLLSYFHCNGGSPNIDFNGIIEKATGIAVKERKLRWHDWERYSARQGTRMKMGGFAGEITFEGNIEPFLPLIRAGEILHVGKATAFGLGKYEMQDQ